MMKSNSLVKSSKLIQLLEHIFKCSTTLLQEIVDRHRDGKLRPISWIRILFYCYCVSIGIRILFASIYSNNPEKYEFIGNYQHDQYVNWINTMKNSNNSAMIGYSIIPLVSLAIYFDYLIYVRPNQYVWSLMHQLMVENSRDFFHLNSHLILDYQMNHSTTNAIKSIKSKLKMVYKIWNTDNARFASKHLSHILNIDPQIRIRTILIMKLHERYEILFQLFTATSLIYLEMTFIVDYYYNETFSLFHLVFIAIDQSITMYITWRTVILNLFALYYTIIGCYMYANHLNNINRQLRNTISQWKAGKLPQETLASRTIFFRREHTVMFCDAIITNKRVVAISMLVCTTVMFFSTICLFSMLIFYQLSYTTQFGIINFLIFEFGWFTMSLQPEVKAIQQLYQSDSLVFKMLQCFQSKHFIMEKIKLANYYELLHTNNREYFTIGDLAKINQQTILQVHLIAF